MAPLGGRALVNGLSDDTRRLPTGTFRRRRLWLANRIGNKDGMQHDRHIRNGLEEDGL